ncbi:hypothetical protein [Micromonospora echinofusca]|uniref:hypothetical protein n=1 Tax=Micromonospora echinofusca TaxID=47858 RepID=UPI000B5AED74|nr:hypothetical protein [Micromonospora echinofusca]
MRIATWIKELSSFRYSSFSMYPETLDQGLHYDVRLRYSWRPNPDCLRDQPRMPDPLARHILRETVRRIAGQYRLFEHGRAEDAVNAELCRDVCDAEARILISGSGRISVSRAARRAMRRRTAEEDALHTAFARETVQLRMLQRRLTDPALGLVWWVDRYADLQFAAGDPKAKVTSIVAAFQTLRETLDDADDGDAEPRVQIRRAVEEILAGVEDPDTLVLAMEMLHRTLRQAGLVTRMHQRGVDN